MHLPMGNVSNYHYGQWRFRASLGCHPKGPWSLKVSKTPWIWQIWHLTYGIHLPLWSEPREAHGYHRAFEMALNTWLTLALGHSENSTLHFLKCYFPIVFGCTIWCFVFQTVINFNLSLYMWHSIFSLPNCMFTIYSLPNLYYTEVTNLK